MDVALATCSNVPDLDPDDRLLVQALAARGISAGPAVWDAPSFEWRSVKACVIRSTWDYHLRRAEFVDWASRVGGLLTLMNPFEILRWNTHKGYLRDLAARGVSVVPTEWVAEGARVDLDRLLAARGWDDAVVKPAVSAGARATIRVSASTRLEAQAHLDLVAAEGDVMIQPYLPSVEGYGERSIIVIDGEPSHAVRKRSALGSKDVAEATSVPLEPLEARLARDVVRAAGASLLYARVDLVRDAAGAPLLMELELVEPSLFLATAPHAATRLSEAIAARLSGVRG